MILAEDADIKEVLVEFNNSPFNLVYAFTNPEDTKHQKIFQEAGIRKADQKVLFAKQIKKANTTELSITAIDMIVPGLVDLAIQSGEYSRFKKDPRLNKFHETLYKEWILKSLKGNFDDVVFVANGNKEKVSGLVTVKKHISTGRIGLISVDQEARGLGIGRQLVQQAENWCFVQGLKDMEVVTQMDNTLAYNFYISCGFKLRKRENIYHLWK